MKAGYEGTAVDTEVDHTLYRTLLSAFPEAVIEDPGVTEETRSMLAEARDRLSWDLPVEGLADLDALPWEPRWINVKPSRFGTVESLFETIAYCLENDIRMYGGGQFELGVGRGQIQALAALFYLAPGVYNAGTPQYAPSQLRFRMRYSGIDRGTARGRTGTRSDETVSPLQPPDVARVGVTGWRASFRRRVGDEGFNHHTT